MEPRYVPTSELALRKILEDIPNNVIRSSHNRRDMLPEFAAAWADATKTQRTLLAGGQKLHTDALTEKTSFERLKTAVFNAKRNERFEKVALKPIPITLANGGTLTPILEGTDR